MQVILHPLASLCSPPYCAFSANQSPAQSQKDSVRNAELTGVFCWNQANYEQRHDVNNSAAWLPRETDEFNEVGIAKQEARLVNCPMVKTSKMKFECRYHSTLRLPGEPPMGSVDIVIGRVIGIHIDKTVLTREGDGGHGMTHLPAVPRPPSPALPDLLPGMIDYGRLQPIARMGYNQYAVITRENLFCLDIPTTEADRALAAQRGGDTAINAGLEGSLHANRNLQGSK